LKLIKVNKKKLQLFANNLLSKEGGVKKIPIIPLKKKEEVI
jgi:hypothetical protein